MARHNKVRLGSDYYGLDSTGKVLYHSGMPLRYIKGEEKVLYFRNETLPSGKFLPDTQQMEFYNNFAKSIPDNPGLTIFNSVPTEQDAMEAITKLLRYYVMHHKFANFEFVHPTETIPQDPEERAAIYILTGIHHSDPMIMPHVRRWVSYPTGSQIWLVLNAAKPFTWCVDTLARKPDALFSLDKAVIKVG